MTEFTKHAQVNVATTTSPLATGLPHVVVNGPARLFGVYVNTILSNHVQYIQDYDPTSSPLTARTIATIPAQAAAGSMYNFPGVEAEHQLRVLSSNVAATGAITVIYKPGTARSLGLGVV